MRPAQEYKNIEVVIVDDGSPLPEAQRYLAQLDQELKEAVAFKLKGRLVGRIARQDQRGPGAGRNLASTLVRARDGALSRAHAGRCAARVVPALLPALGPSGARAPRQRALSTCAEMFVRFLLLQVNPATEFIMFMDDDNIAKPHEISTFVKVRWLYRSVARAPSRRRLPGDSRAPLLAPLVPPAVAP